MIGAILVVEIVSIYFIIDNCLMSLTTLGLAITVTLILLFWVINKGASKSNSYDHFEKGIYIISVILFILTGYAFQVFYLSWLFLPFGRAIILFKKSRKN